MYWFIIIYITIRLKIFAIFWIFRKMLSENEYREDAKSLQAIFVRRELYHEYEYANEA